MNRDERAKATPEQKALYQRQFGIVVLAAIFGGFIVVDLIVLFGGPIAVAIPAGAIFGIVLGFNVLRVLRRRAAAAAPPE